ncbi:hypothetical protein AGABI2DRAFT_145653 [Agaricus bisporus var. bisporus H97]|uniref:hypothetical protein n=1 Tax=Agaricus bisporus var. bisporus (strain H97 / ATCC MYA-4626 / FGSC 10389) TaxID=936046 RepID=UPI00029F59CC|nr:hypothetical protein AGABI2DRAFT_145653 [Agaricus bisporus var. bisporus H97]EKV44272.1 hypothetical protein AGABI2DRAFT_145653 [Agaricus bisporus var. bisporus H97]
MLRECGGEGVYFAPTWTYWPPPLGSDMGAGTIWGFSCKSEMTVEWAESLLKSITWANRKAIFREINAQGEWMSRFQIRLSGMTDHSVGLKANMWFGRDCFEHMGAVRDASEACPLVKDIHTWRSINKFLPLVVKENLWWIENVKPMDRALSGEGAAKVDGLVQVIKALERQVAFLKKEMWKLKANDLPESSAAGKQGRVGSDGSLENEKSVSKKQKKVKKGDKEGGSKESGPSQYYENIMQTLP